MDRVMDWLTWIALGIGGLTVVALIALEIIKDRTIRHCKHIWVENDWGETVCENCGLQIRKRREK